MIAVDTNVLVHSHRLQTISRLIYPQSAGLGRALKVFGRGRTSLSSADSMRLKGLIQQISHWTKAGNVERNLVKLACDTYGQAEEKS